MDFQFVDAFAGCGGLSLGLVQAGMVPIMAVEAHSDAFATYKRNIIERFKIEASWALGIPISNHDVCDLVDRYRPYLQALRGRVDLLAGGPPCQGFSANGRRDPNDPRNELAERYLDLVDVLRPKLLLLENVRGFTTLARSDGQAFSDFIAGELERRGYDVWGQLLEAADWGVPQGRVRFFLVAAPRGALRGIDPFARLRVARQRFLDERGLPRAKIGVADAIGDLRTEGAQLVPDVDFARQGFSMVRYERPSVLPPLARYLREGARGQPGDMRLPRHSPEVVERFQTILDTCEKGRAITKADRDRLGISKRSTTPLASDLPSTTITTLPDDRLHYCEPRILTVRETARLQSFPDWFRFYGPYTTGGARRQWEMPRYTQVGNAVPPLLARALGEMLLSLASALSLNSGVQGSEVCEMSRQSLPESRKVITGEGIPLRT